MTTIIQDRCPQFLVVGDSPPMLFFVYVEVGARGLTILFGDALKSVL